MIREIAAKSLGAQIKIMSSKEAEREAQDCIVTIAGSLKNKQDACGLIVEQIEAFRSGAPAPTNGKSGDRDSGNRERQYGGGRESPEPYLAKRQEYKRHSRSPSPDK